MRVRQWILLKTTLGHLLAVTLSPMQETDIEAFWSAHPCGDAQVGGLDEHYRRNYEAFFNDYDAFRYRSEAHIPACLDQLDVRDKTVLEVGLGEGAESEQLIRRGAVWSGIDLTAESVERVSVRMQLRSLPYDSIERGSVLDLPFQNDSFDKVFSHGVLHHVPDIARAQGEIARVLRPGGELVVMVYARWSLNYLVSICLLRRLAVAAAYPVRRSVRPDSLLGLHLANADRLGLRRYLRMENFIHANTDGPRNPYARVYDLRRIRSDFPSFEVVRSWRAFMHAPPLPVTGSAGGSVLGWHLWVVMRART
jgi:SAM-dependent methyltransferase